MITLHGFAASNYYNIVKHVLLYKNIPFREHLIYSGDDEWLAISPVGKVPAITTEDGHHLSETTVICDYLEEVYPDSPLYPDNPVDRAHVRQIMKVAELYLELTSRKLIPYAFSGSPAPEAALNDARHVTNRGIGAMQRLCRFDPYIAGATLTLADIYVYYVNAVVMSVGSPQMEWDVVGEIPGMKQWSPLIGDTAIAKSVAADREANEPDFYRYIQEYMAKSAQPGSR